MEKYSHQLLDCIALPVRHYLLASQSTCVSV